MNRFSRLLTTFLLVPLLYGAAGRLGLVSGSKFWPDPAVILPLSGAAWLAAMGGIMLAGSGNNVLANLAGLVLVFWAIGAQVSPDVLPMLALGTAVGAITMLFLNAPAGWARSNMILSLIAISCLLIGRYV